MDDQPQNGSLFGGFHHGLKFARAVVRGVEFAGQARNGIEEKKAAAAFYGIFIFFGRHPAAERMMCRAGAGSVPVL